MKQKIHKDFHEAVRNKHPGIDFRTDVIVQDDSDGEGPHLVAWNLPGKPLTDAQIEAEMIKIKGKEK